MKEVFWKSGKNQKNTFVSRAVLILATLFTLAAGCIMKAAPVSAESPYVFDNYGLFTEKQDKELEEACQAFHNAHPDLEAYFITVDNADVGGSTDWYTQEYLEQFAQSHSDGNSIAMVINMETRYYYVDVYGDHATECYPYGQQDKIRDRIVEDLYADDYYGAAETFLAQAEKYSSDSKLEGFGALDLLICLIIGAVAAAAVTGVRAAKHRNVRMKTDAGNYMVSDSLKFRVHNDRFIRTYTTTVRKAETSSGGGGGHTSAGHSSGHSGGGGHF